MKYFAVIFFSFAVITFSFFSEKSFGKKMLSSAKSVAVIELFTSQGCSSCPPADELIGNYVKQNDQSVICLSFNVDYWNRLGWKDVFSNASYSQRQQQYAQILHSGVYTPQVVINGKYQFVGGDKKNIQRSIDQISTQAATAEIEAQQSFQGNNMFLVSYQLSGDFLQNDLVAVLVQNVANTKINAGENDGAALSEYNIVRDLKVINSPLAKGNIQLELPKNLDKKQCSIVLFLQKKNQGAIVSAKIIHT